MDYQKFTVDKDYHYVYKFLLDKGLSHRYLSFLRKELGRIKINGNPVNIKHNLVAGDTLEVVADNNVSTTIADNSSTKDICILPLDIVYEDAYYLLINKPSGLSTIPSRSHYQDNLSSAVKAYLQASTIRVINRLDRETAGIVIFAKSLMAINMLKQVNKTYYALANGNIENELVIDKPIATRQENGINIRKREIGQDGKPAKTFVQPVLHLKDCTLIKVTLEHGRTHQIRVHLASIGHALLGDHLYGDESTLIGHTALVCKEVSFFHPFLNKELHFSIDYPEDFKNILESK